MQLHQVELVFWLTLAVSVVIGEALATWHGYAMRSFHRTHHGESAHPKDRPAMIAPLSFLIAPVFLFSLVFPVVSSIHAAASKAAIDWIDITPLLICSFVIGAFGTTRLLLAVFHRRFAWLRRWLCDARLEDLDPPERVLPEAIQVSLLGQYGLYGVVVVGLWILHLTGRVGSEARFAQIVLLFIADDWNIIAAYLTASRGRIRSLDRMRIVATNLLISVLFLAAMQAAFGVGWTVIAGVALCSCVLFGAAYWAGMVRNFPSLKHLWKEAS